MESVNDTQLDAQIRHQIMVLRLRNGIVTRMLNVLDRADADAIGRLVTRLQRIEDRGFDLGPATTERLERVIVAIQNTRAEVVANAGELLTSELEDFLRFELTWQTGLLEGAVSEIGLDVVSPTIARVRAAAFSRPFQTRLLRDWVRDLGANDRRRLRHAIQDGVIEGLTTPQIARSVQNELGTTRRHATTIARTATNHVANAARREVGAANADIIKGVRYVATLDSRTTPICQALDGQVFPVDSGPRPPQHLQCRSTITYVLKGVPGNTGTRAAFDGQVPSDLTYDQWLRRQPREFVEGVLGKTRARLYLDGNLSVTRFVDRSGDEYTLAELRRRDPDAFRLAEVS